MPGRSISVSNSVVRRSPKPHTKSSHAFRSFKSVQPPNRIQTRSLTSAIPSSSNAESYAWQTQLVELQKSLTDEASPSRVWSNYTNLLGLFGFERVPPEIHQVVLRQCTPSAQRLRISAARRLLAGNKPHNPHIHEGRFQAIIRNIRASGALPTLDDYHFILSQFAAVGHHVGSMQVYKELTHVGIVPTPKTIGLCFQAIAHRFTLPIYKQSRPRLVEQTRKMFADLLKDVHRYDIPLLSVNLDLAMRILKENLDREGFESMMRWTYGIDLSNPDRAPLEILERKHLVSLMEAPGIPGTSIHHPLPFSTAALNTTIDILGRFADVSKLVQAFEVLTTPLPRANEHFFSSFDDEDDFGVKVDVSPAFSPPYATPNTTTYNYLLRHLCRCGHATFARHYINQAMRLERQVATTLRQQVLKRIPLDQIPAPHFSINRGTLLPAFGESNRDKNLGLMRWLSTKMARIIRKKKEDLQFYTSLRDTLEIETAHPSASKPTSEVVQPPSSSSISPSIRKGRTEPTPIFDLDLDSMDPPPPTPFKTFNINLHIGILERNIWELESFSQRLTSVLGRTTQRVKERLGRRVWANKDVFLSTTRRRTTVSRKDWTELVSFKPRPTSDPVPTLRPSLRARSESQTPNVGSYGQQRLFSTVFAGPRSSSAWSQSDLSTWQRLWQPPRS